MKLEMQILTASFILTAIVALIVLPILKKLKIGQIERELQPQTHLKKQGTPTMGGIMIVITMIILGGLLSVYYTKLPILLFVCIGFGLIGFIDDFKKLVLKNTKGLKPMYKIIGLLLISVIYAIYILNLDVVGNQTYIPIIKQYITIPSLLYIPFVIFVMIGTTNAVNLTDGVDGLASSVGIIIITCLTVIAKKLGIEEIAILGSICCGAYLGFLLFNLHPAKVFMGDTGSLLLGGIIVVMALYLKMPLLLILIAIIPVIETTSVMIQVTYFKKTGKRIFKMTPIHHHFELLGWNENKVVSVFSIITLIACIIGIVII